MKIIDYVFPYLSNHKRKFFVYSFLSLVLWSLSLITPYSVGNYLDSLLQYKSDTVIWETVAMLAIFWTMQLVLSYTKNIVNSELHSKVCYQIKKNLLAHLMRLPISFFTNQNSAYLNQRITADTQSLTHFAINELVNLVETILSILCVGVIVFSVNKGIFLFLCVLLPLYLLLYHVFKAPLYSLHYQQSEAYGQFYSSNETLLAHAKAVKLHEWQNRLFSEIDRLFCTLHGLTMKNAQIGYIFNNADAMIRYLANIGIYIYSGYQILAGQLSIGEFTMVCSYSLMLISCMGVVLRFGKTYRHATVAFDRIMAFVELTEEECGVQCPESISEIRVNELSFNYGDNQVIRNMSFSLKRGSIYAVVGENGSGKSTLINILCGLEHGYTGQITVNGVDFKKIDLHHFKKHLLSVVEQEPSLFFKTIKDNITPDDCDTNSTIYWIERLNLSELISAFDAGLDHCISEKTSNLSGGEKQKFAVVRALAKNTDVIILDEPNSAFDQDSTNLLCEILQSLKSSKIIIVVTHSQALIENSDVVISLAATQSNATSTGCI